jgi:hypothetical protein
MIRPSVRSALAGVLVLAAPAAALAAASSVPFDYKPDPALQRASRTEIETRFRRACSATQARIQSTTEAAVNRGCGCYASRTLRSLDQGELEAYRSSGVFNTTARGKALAALDACKLPRPV